MRVERYDAVVLGGGPAGSTAANLLARAGRRVLVLEKARFPRHHIGESLLPGLNYLYRRLGVDGLLRKEGFFRKTGGSYAWGKGRTPWSIDFIRFNEAPVSCATPEEVTAYHVDRSRFDELLLDAAAAAGARVLQGAAVTEVALEGPRRIGRVTFRTAGGKRRAASAEFYLDATGQAALLARKLGWQEYDPQLRHLAVYTYFRGARLLPRPRRNHIFIVSVGDGWLWFIPLSERRVSVGAVASVDRAREAGSDPEGFLLSRIARAPELKPLLAGARRIAPLRIERDWSYRSKRFAGENFLLVGDAAAFVDPLLSYGVTLAMHSAALAADCVSLALERPARRAALLRHYERVHGERFDELLDFVKYFYDGNRHREEYFWKARRIVRHLSNRYAKYAFTYLVSGYTMWDKIYHKGYFDRFFSGLGAPVEELRRDARFLAAVGKLRTVDLPLIDEPLPPPPGADGSWSRRSLALRYAELAQGVETGYPQFRHRGGVVDKCAPPLGRPAA